MKPLISVITLISRIEICCMLILDYPDLLPFTLLYSLAIRKVPLTLT